jgi:hypothetical protein
VKCATENIDVTLVQLESNTQKSERFNISEFSTISPNIYEEDFEYVDPITEMYEELGLNATNGKSYLILYIN